MNRLMDREPPVKSLNKTIFIKKDYAMPNHVKFGLGKLKNCQPRNKKKVASIQGGDK